MLKHSINWNLECNAPTKMYLILETTINQSGVDEDVFVDDGHVMQVGGIHGFT